MAEHIPLPPAAIESTSLSPVPVGGVKCAGLGEGAQDGGKGAGGRGSFKQRKLNRLSGGAKRKYDPFEEPLPIAFRICVSGNSTVYERMQLPADALASMWRDYHPDTPIVATFANRPKPPGLFDTVPISRCPHEPLVPATRSSEPKVRRQRELMLRDLMVRIARKHLGYCIGREIKEPSPEELAQMNAKIQAVLPDHTLTAAEAKCWCYHERPLIGDTQKYYIDALAAYQRNSNDVIDLLLPEQGRFANLSAERMAQVKLLSRAVRMGPFEERDGELVELVELQSVNTIWQVDGEASESITITKGDKSIKLSPLASNIYQANFTQLKSVCKHLSKQSEVGRRIKQPLSATNGMPRPSIEEPKRKKLKEDHVSFAPPPNMSSQPLRDGAGLDATVRSKVLVALRVLSTEDLERVAKAVGSRLFSATREEVETAAYTSFFDGIPLQTSLQVPLDHMGQHHMQQMQMHLGPGPPAEPETPTGGTLHAFGRVVDPTLPVLPPPPPPH